MGNANSSKKIPERLDKRKCMTESCSGEMNLVMLNGQMVWTCRKCGNDVPKMPKDYTFADRDREWGKKEDR